MSKAAFNSIPEITLPEGRGPLVVRGDGIEVEFRDGEIHVRSGKIASTPIAELKVGDVVHYGPNTGWIYCETKQGEPFLVAPKDGNKMQWLGAVHRAEYEKAELPSQEQLAAMYEARLTGALRDTFNAIGDEDAGWYWSAKWPNIEAWRRGLRYEFRYDYPPTEAWVRCVRRCSII
jgi:hypothetical protein